MRALVTGGTGFIGANLVAALNRQGITARVLRRSSSSTRALEGLAYETVFGDVLDEADVLVRAVEGCDWVFHVAGVADYWRRGREWLYQVNVEGTRRMLQAACLGGAGRFVFTSSLAALGVPEPGTMLDEAHRFNLPPQAFPYGHSKHLAELELLRAADDGLEAVIVNPSVVLGPRDVNLISGSIVVEAARGRLRFITPGGVNFVAVEDVAAGQIAAAERGRSGERYILGGENLPYSQAIPTICRIVGRSRPRFKIPAWILPYGALAVRAARVLLGNRIPMDENQVRLLATHLYADNSKARSELDLPQTPFETAVQRTYNWYNECGYLD